MRSKDRNMPVIVLMISLALWMIVLMHTAIAQTQDYLSCGNGICDEDDCPADNCCFQQEADTDTDESNCGECGNECRSSEFCLKGRCIRSCIDFPGECNSCKNYADGKYCDCDGECISGDCIENVCSGDTNTELEEAKEDMEEEAPPVVEEEEEVVEDVIEDTTEDESTDTEDSTDADDVADENEIPEDIVAMEYELVINEITKSIKLWQTGDERYMSAEGIQVKTDLMLDVTSGKLYLYDKQNYKTQIKVLPAKAKENFNIVSAQDEIAMTLDFANFVPIYRVEGTRTGKLFGIINKKITTEALVSAIDGIVLEVNKPWWDIFIWG